MNKNKVLKALELQKEMFGDELYQNGEFTVKTPDFKKELGEEKKEKAGEYSLSGTKELPIDDFDKAGSLEQLENTINECTKCELSKGRNNFVFGEGNPDTDAMVIGEGPGAEEDKQGRPFVGRAGKLLDKILKAIKFEREDVFIANIVKCRPPSNRTPHQSEMDTCFPFLDKQIELIKPKVILCLGTTAARALLGKKDSLGKMRGQVFNYKGIKVVVTYHPAALLRNPNWKKGCWEDVQIYKKIYDKEI